MSEHVDGARRFLELHTTERPLLLPNPWDPGSACILAWLGFKALATTSSGLAASLGQVDGTVGRDAAVSHAAAVGEATGLPVNGDFENCYSDDPDGVAETVALARDAGIAGCSVEDWSGAEIYERGHAVERVAAASEAAHSGAAHLVLTARAENLIHGRRDLDDTIERLRAYQAAGADVLYAPGLRTMDEIRAVLEAVERPVNVLALPGVPSVNELAEAGVSRVSVGGAFAFAAYGALVEAAEELRGRGTYDYLERAGIGLRARGALGDR
jgi:2-methylisocitrate lyase-like PEP mutase family enzyme